MYLDPLYLIFSIPALLIGLIASIVVNATFSKYSKMLNSRGVNGIDTVSKISEEKGYSIHFSLGSSALENHYNPLNSTIMLSEVVARTQSIASVAIAAHEVGHAAQHKSKSLGLTLRTFIAPAISITTNLGYFLLLSGIILSLTNLAWLGIILFSSSTIFSFLTLPVEFNASRRAIKFIKEFNLLDAVEIQGAKEVLTAAALTYVASTVQSLSILIYFFLRVRGLNRSR